MVITEAKSEEILRADLAKLEERTDAKLEHLGVGCALRKSWTLIPLNPGQRFH
ncbi:hypothetical protein [Ensifer sp. Root142]|uniref:hypothetical protein n=1 Tax=Ensifer sp. Root142 TaxID=1736461 RepID=UPI0019106C5C|nr:hypothetical protein [Ensifer sp. Root142]